MQIRSGKRIEPFISKVGEEWRAYLSEPRGQYHGWYGAGHDRKGAVKNLQDRLNSVSAAIDCPEEGFN